MQTVLRKKVLTIRQFGDMCAFLEKQECCANDQHTLHYALVWMRDHHISDLQANFAKFVDLAAMCDCDVLEVLDDEVWEAARSEDLTGPEIHGSVKWDNTILSLLMEAG